MRVEMSKQFEDPHYKRNDKEIQSYLDSEVVHHSKIHPNMPEIIAAMQLSPDQVDKLVKVRREFCSGSARLRQERDEIVHKLKTVSLSAASNSQEEGPI